MAGYVTSPKEEKDPKQTGKMLILIYFKKN